MIKFAFGILALLSVSCVTANGPQFQPSIASKEVAVWYDYKAIHKAPEACKQAIGFKWDSKECLDFHGADAIQKLGVQCKNFSYKGELKNIQRTGLDGMQDELNGVQAQQLNLNYQWNATDLTGRKILSKATLKECSKVLLQGTTRIHCIIECSEPDTI